MYVPSFVLAITFRIQELLGDLECLFQAPVAKKIPDWARRLDSRWISENRFVVSVSKVLPKHFKDVKGLAGSFTIKLLFDPTEPDRKIALLPLFGDGAIRRINDREKQPKIWWSNRLLVAICQTAPSSSPVYILAEVTANIKDPRRPWFRRLATTWEGESSLDEHLDRIEKITEAYWEYQKLDRSSLEWTYSLLQQWTETGEMPEELHKHLSIQHPQLKVLVS